MGVLARAGEAHEEGCGGLQPPKGWGGHVGRVDAHIAPQIHPQRLLRPQGGLVNPMIRQLAPSPSNGSSRPMSALWLRWGSSGLMAGSVPQIPAPESGLVGGSSCQMADAGLTAA